MHSMRLFLMKGAARISSTAWQEIGPAVERAGEASGWLWQLRKDTTKIAMDARPRGPTAKLQPSPKGLETNPEGDLSAVGAALNRARHNAAG